MINGNNKKQYLYTLVSLVTISSLFYSHLTYSEELPVEEVTEQTMESNTETSDILPTPEIPPTTPTTPDTPPPTPEEPPVENTNNPVVEIPMTVVETLPEDNSWNTPVEKPYTPPSNLPKIKARPEEKNITINTNSSQTCSVENFLVNISAQTEVQNKIILSNTSSTSKEIEVLGVPNGYTVEFANGTTKRNIGQEKILPFNIKKTAKAQKGNFNISFVFTEKGASRSSTICQFNLVN